VSSIHDRRHAFRRLHEAGGTFVMPNPWDVGTARFLQSLGFKALATTSAGVAFSQGFPDTDWAVPRDAMLAHIREIVEAVDVPVNADFESGYAHEPGDVAKNVRLCVDTGVAGLSIEDATGEPSRPLYDLSLAQERIAAARAAIDEAGKGVVLTARAECWLVGHAAPLDESIRRLVAYAEAGADCLYAPGCRTPEQIRAIVEAVAPKPVNVLIPAGTTMGVDDFSALGVKRLSGGSALCRVAWGAFMQAARSVAATGRFDALAEAVPFDEINGFFRDDLAHGRRPTR